MKSKKNESSLGKSLMKKRKKQPKNKEARFEHVEFVKEDPNKLQSIVEQNPLTEFLQAAELSSKKFEADKNIKISTTNAGETIIIDINSLKSQQKPQNLSETSEILKNLRVPRRPKWDESTSAALLQQLENTAFLNWRRELAKIEENYQNLHITPYEKNPEIWRQLWRVVEKSDIVVQIVDGRDPLFFRCEDVETYVKEIDKNKENVLLINKADLLSENIRKHWNNYLVKHKINHIFFSARAEQEKINLEEKLVEENSENTIEKIYNSYKIASRDVLLESLKSLAFSLKTQRKPNEIITIGMVGYPNVGKSSVINVLCGKKLVGVGARPGKTKHFQTIFIEKDVVLCDCPGLVFPSVVSTKAEMVCNGVLPIDNLKDYIGPVEVLCDKVPKFVFERLYHIKLEEKRPSATSLLSTFARNRGFFTGGSGLPDFAKVARIILKDLVNGRLLFCRLSPEYDEKTEGYIEISNEIAGKPEEILKENDKEEEKIDEVVDFFDKNSKEFDENDVENLLKGKTVKGVKLNKLMRREIKFAMKRGENIDLNQLLNSDKKAKFIGKMGKYADKPNNIPNKMSELFDENEDFEDIEESEEDEKTDK